MVVEPPRTAHGINKDNRFGSVTSLGRKCRILSTHDILGRGLGRVAQRDQANPGLASILIPVKFFPSIFTL